MTWIIKLLYPAVINYARGQLAKVVVELAANKLKAHLKKNKGNK